MSRLLALALWLLAGCASSSASPTSAPGTTPPASALRRSLGGPQPSASTSARPQWLDSR